MKNKNKIIALVLSLLMLFSNVLNVFAFNFEAPIINGDEVILDNDNSSLIDNTVIINSNENLIENNKPTITTNIENTLKPIENKENKKEILTETFSQENGKTVKVAIEPVFQPITLRNGDKTLTLVGGDKGADASVSFKGDESGATS